MEFFLVLIAMLGADPNPEGEPDFAAYFKRQDEKRSSEIKALDTKIDQLKIAIAGESLRQRQGVLRGELNKTEKLLERLRKLPLEPFTFPEGRQSGVNTIGALPNVVVAHIVDDKRVIVTTTSIVGRCHVVLTDVDARQFKLRQKITSPQVWQVISQNAKDERIHEILTSTNPYDLIVTSTYYVVRPIAELDLAKARIKYDANQLAQ